MQGAGRGGGGGEGGGGAAGQHHVRAIFVDSALFCNHLVLPVICDRESLLVVWECRDSDQS